MKMVDMKMSKKATKGDMAVSAPEQPKDEYPYGLRVSLDNEQLSKLDLDSGQVGDEVMIMAHGCITSKSENKQQDGKAERRMEIQIKSLSIQNDSADEAEYLDEKTPTEKRIEMSQARKGR